LLRGAHTHPPPTEATVNATDRYGRPDHGVRPDAPGAGVQRRLEGPAGATADHLRPVVGLQGRRLPGDRDPKPVWLWVSKPAPDGAVEVDHWWSICLRRFDLEPAALAETPGPSEADPARVRADYHRTCRTALHPASGIEAAARVDGRQVR
jgi:hypothetical protein